MGSVATRVYTDAGANANRDLIYQLGFIILLVDKELCCNVLHCSSNNLPRHAKWMISSENYAFAYEYDICVLAKILL